MSKYLEGARKRWLGEEHDLKHRVGARQFSPEVVDWYRGQIFSNFPDNSLKHQTVLDYGCGLGRLMFPLSEQLGGFWYGTDISPDMISTIVPRVEAGEGHNIAGVATTDGDGIPDGFVEDVDFIYSVITLQHVSDHTVVKSILRSFSTHLRRRTARRERGWFCIQVKLWREGLRPWNYVPPESGEPEPTGYDALPAHLQAEEGCAYTHEQIIQVCAESGLHVLESWETDPIDDHGRWLWVRGVKSASER